MSRSDAQASACQAQEASNAACRPSTDTPRNFEGGSTTFSFSRPSTVRCEIVTRASWYRTEARTVRRTLPQADCERSACALEFGNIVEGAPGDSIPPTTPSSHLHPPLTASRRERAAVVHDWRRIGTDHLGGAYSGPLRLRKAALDHVQLATGAKRRAWPVRGGPWWSGDLPIPPAATRRGCDI